MQVISRCYIIMPVREAKAVEQNLDKKSCKNEKIEQLQLLIYLG